MFFTDEQIHSVVKFGERGAHFSKDGWETLVAGSAKLIAYSYNSIEIRGSAVAQQRTQFRQLVSWTHAPHMFGVGGQGDSAQGEQWSVRHRHHRPGRTEEDRRNLWYKVIKGGDQ
jgi:hypothetical protein